MEAADLLPGEQVHVLDVDNGARFETYVSRASRSGGDLCLNGRRGLVQPGRGIVVSYGDLLRDELEMARPASVHVDERNSIVRVDGDPSALPFAELPR